MDDSEDFRPSFTQEMEVVFPIPMLNAKEHGVLRKKAFMKVVSKHYEDDFYDQIEKGNIADPYLKELVVRKVEKQKSCTSEWIFLTVNPSTDDYFEVLMKKMEKFMKRLWVTDYIYAIEQRSEIENVYTGIHAHAYIKRNGKPPSEVKREIKSTFKSIVGTDKAIDIKFDADSSRQNRIRYILGTKSGDKDAKVQNDLLFRESKGIEMFYSSDNFLTKYVS